MYKVGLRQVPGLNIWARSCVHHHSGSSSQSHNGLIPEPATASPTGVHTISPGAAVLLKETLLAGVKHQPLFPGH